MSCVACRHHFYIRLAQTFVDGTKIAHISIRARNVYRRDYFAGINLSARNGSSASLVIEEKHICGGAIAHCLRSHCGADEVRLEKSIDSEKVRSTEGPYAILMLSRHWSHAWVPAPLSRLMTAQIRRFPASQRRSTVGVTSPRLLRRSELCRRFNPSCPGKRGFRFHVGMKEAHRMSAMPDRAPFSQTVRAPFWPVSRAVFQTMKLHYNLESASGPSKLTSTRS